MSFTPNDGGVPRVLTVVVEGKGTVRSTPSGIECTGRCEAKFDPGNSVSLRAEAVVGWVFDGWREAGCSGTGECKVTLSDDVQVFASFRDSRDPAPGTYRVSVTLTGTGAGHVTSNAGGITCPSTCFGDSPDGKSMALTAVVDGDSRFAGWSGGGCSGTGTCTVTGKATVSAAFAHLCDDLKPGDVGNPKKKVVTHDRARSGVLRCEPGTTDGEGTFALSYDVTGQPFTGNFTFVDRNGADRGTAKIPGLNTPIGQATGFLGVAQESAPPSYVLLAIDPNGTQHRRGSAFRGAATAFNYPLGGVLVYDAGANAILAYSASVGEGPRWSIQLGETGFKTLGVDRRGNVLVLFDGTRRFMAGTLAGQWIDPDGKAGTVFNAGAVVSTSSPFELFPRVGDGLHLSENQKWIAQFDGLSTAPKPPPDWLAARPRTKLRMVRGGKGYAALPYADVAVPACTQEIEVLSPAGKRCGAARFAVSSDACTTGNIDIGYDGTILQQLPTSKETCNAQNICTCTWQWWSGFFGG